MYLLYVSIKKLRGNINNLIAMRPMRMIITMILNLLLYCTCFDVSRIGFV